MQSSKSLALIIFALLVCGIGLIQGQSRAAGAGECTWFAGTVVLNSTVMLPSQCVELGGNCCTWNGSGWNDGVGAWQDPAEMSDSWGILCNGCCLKP